MDRVDEELALLRTEYPDIDALLADDSWWARIPRYRLPARIWHATKAIEVAFQIPPQVGQAPYAFRVRPGLTLASGSVPANYTYPTVTPWGADWGQFSWSPATWEPKADLRAGSNMLRFARSFAERLREPD